MNNPSGGHQAQAQQQQHYPQINPSQLPANVQAMMQNALNSGIPPDQVMGWLQQNMARINSQHLNQQQQQFAQPPAQMPQTISPSALQVSPQQHQQQPDHAHLSEAQQNMPNLAPPRQSLDASAAAKQIAALSAAARSRVRSHGGPNPYGNPNGSIENSASTPRPATSSGLNNSLLPPLPPTQPAEAPKAQPSSMPFPNPNPRAQAFLKILADFMVNRGTPLPPSLTGVATPSYNPLQSHFRWLEAPGVGVFRLAERLVDLQDLFNVVTKAGGFQKVTHDNTWESLLPAFHLPNQYVPTAAPGGATQSSTPVAPILAKFYSLLLSPFEDWFIKQQQAKMMSARQQQQALGGAGPSQPANPAQGGFPPSAPPSHPPHPLGFPALPQSWPPAGPSAGGMENDMSDEGRKRKEREHEEEMAAGKRLRIDTESSSIHPTHVNGSAASATGPEFALMSSISQAQSRQNTGAVIGGETPSATSDHHQVPPSAITSHAAPPAQRFKIEYVPLQRTVNTYGGRNLDVIETQLERMRSRRIPRGPDELGLVDIIGLALSVRSRLSIELSYALTVLTILSTTGANQPSLGFPIYKCGDLLEVVIDLLEDEAFPEGSSLDESNTEGYNRKIYTHPELIRIASEEGSSLFSSSALFRTKSKEKPKSQDPKAKPSEIILTILNILRNLSMFPDNATFMCRDTRTLDVLSRVCSIHPTLPKPASPSLTLSNLLIARNDTIQILANVSASAHLPSHTPLTTILTFHLITSYLIDPSDALSPSQHVTFPMTASTPPLPPPSIELALEAFSRLSQPDLNRKRLAELIPSAHLYTLFTCLVHMLPLAENDFTITVLAPLLNETWLAYLERIVLSIYSLAFLASPSLKTQMRKMNGFRFIVTRMIRYYLRGVKEEGGVGHQGPPVQFAERSFEKSQYGIMIRRMIEAMGMLDSGEDTFGDVAGVGGGGEEVSLRSIFGGDEGWGKKKLEGREGAGMLSGSFEDVLGLFAVEGMDRLTFDEVESLVRVPVS